MDPLLFTHCLLAIFHLILRQFPETITILPYLRFIGLNLPLTPSMTNRQLLALSGWRVEKCRCRLVFVSSAASRSLNTWAIYGFSSMTYMLK